MKIFVDEDKELICIEDLSVDLYGWENIIKLLNILKDEIYIFIDSTMNEKEDTENKKINLIFKPKEKEFSVENAKEFIEEFFNTLIQFQQVNTSLENPELSIEKNE